MPWARGANAVMAAAFEDTYGVAATNGFAAQPFTQSNLGAEQALVTDDTLGQGRNPSDPTFDVITNDGDVTVPACVRNMGYWLKGGLGDPVTTAFKAAKGKLTFSAQPVAASTITLNGTPWTFVAALTTGNQILIGANLAATMTAAATALNASAETQTAKCTYTADATSLSLVNDTIGIAGNAYTLAASGTSNAKLSGPTLQGGANKHVFTAGATVLPPMSIEVGLPDLPKYFMNYGMGVNSLKMSAARSGLLSLVVSLFGKNESVATASQAGTPTVLPTKRLAQFSGSIERDDVALGKVTSGDWTYSNDLEKGEDITETGDISDLTASVWSFLVNLGVRFADTVMLDQATNKEPCKLSFGWKIDDSNSFTVIAARVFVPKPKKPITGPKGIQMTFAGQAARDPDTGEGVTFELVNDVAGY